MINLVTDMHTMENVGSVCPDMHGLENMGGEKIL